MNHKYYDFYMRFPDEASALKARDFYFKKHKPRIGGKFVINDNGICSLSLRDECELITDFYQFGMKRFIVTDNFHGVRYEHGKDIFDFFTDTDVIHVFDYNEKTFDRINDFLTTEIYKDGYIHEGNTQPPFIKRVIESMGIDDLYDMLNVDVPGFDI